MNKTDKTNPGQKDHTVELGDLSVKETRQNQIKGAGGIDVGILVGIDDQQILKR
jgi:hypothetical protein